jgi:hypothetical protein
MAILEHPDTGERVEVEGELSFGAVYTVEGFDEEEGKSWQEDRIRLDGTEYIVVDDGVDMVTLGKDTE